MKWLWHFCGLVIILFNFAHAAELAYKLEDLRNNISAIQDRTSVISKKLEILKTKLQLQILKPKSKARFFTVDETSVELKFADIADFGISPRANFFNDLMGIEEKDFKDKEQEIKSRLIIEKNADSKPCCYYIKGKDGRIYRCGYFQEFRLGDLRKQVAEKLKQNLGPVKFSVIEAGDGTTKSFKYVDIGALQADPKNIGALFGVASNFNALETCGPFDNIDKGINDYPYDNTQGPRASISAAAGLVYRQYYFYYNERKNKPFNLWRQRGQKSIENTDDTGFKLQLNLLEDLGVKTQNGYVWDPNTIMNIKEYDLVDDPNSFTKHSDYFKIGLHQGIQVNFGLTSGYDQINFYNPNQIIHQAFAAALNVAQSPVCKNTTDEQAKLILQWTYEALFLVAVIMGITTVYLTRIGGGAFGNHQDWIDNAIIKAVKKMENSGLNVILNNFKLAEDTSQEVFDRLNNLVADTNGSYIIYRQGKAESKKCKRSEAIIKSKATDIIQQANEWKSIYSFKYGIQILNKLQEFIKQNPNDETAKIARLDLNLKLIMGAYSRLNDVQNPKTGVFTYEYTEHANASRFSAGVQGLKSISYLKSEIGKQDISLSKKVNESKIKESLSIEPAIIKKTRLFLNGAQEDLKEDPSATWIKTAIEDFRPYSTLLWVLEK